MAAFPTDVFADAIENRFKKDMSKQKIWKEIAGLPFQGVQQFANSSSSGTSSGSDNEVVVSTNLNDDLMYQDAYVTALIQNIKETFHALANDALRRCAGCSLRNDLDIGNEFRQRYNI